MRTKLGKYVIKSELGHGSMGVVYWAEDPRLGRPVALKTMSPTVAGDAELLKRFYREAQSAGQLRHPNIVTIYDIDEADGIPFIAMEFLEGESLEKIISARKDLPVVKKLNIVIQACKGLHYAHQHGIVHRDVKPANIVVLNDGLVKIVDFGIARIGGGSMTRTGMVMGTPMFMSPEQVLGQTVDARSDIFSVGVILYEFLTYKNPFSSEDVPSILFKILNETPAPLSSLVPNYPPQLEKVVTRALARNREERHQTAEDMAFELQQAADSLSRHMVEIYIQEGQRSLEEGNLTLAKESLQKVLEVDSNHDLAKSLLAKVQEKMYARQRGEKISQSFRQAKEALQAEQFDEAIAHLDEVLRLEPGHAEAQQSKQMAVDRRDRVRKISRHMARAEKLITDGDLPGAKAQLEALLELDPQHATALRMLESVSKELAERERLRQVRQNTEGARTYLAQKNFAKALELLEEANRMDPMNIEVESLIRLARSGQEKEQRRKLLDQRVASLQEALNREEFDRAVALADAALKEFPEDPQVLKLHTQAGRLAETHKKRRFVDEQIQAARSFLEKNQFSSAIALLERALETAPVDARLTSYLKTVQESQERANVETLRQAAIREANEQIRRKDFPAAIATLEKALARAGQSPDLIEFLQLARDQQAEQQKQERVRQVLSRAQACLREENYEEAVQILERGQSELKTSEIESLLTAARRQGQQFEQRRKETLERALQLLQAGDADKAVVLLDASPRAYFKDEKFQRVYARCREGLGRATLVRNTVEQVEKSIAREDLAQAEALLQQALQNCPDDATLLATQSRLREEQVRFRRALWSRLLDEAKVDMGRMQYKEAIDRLASVDWQSAEVPDLAKEANGLLEEARRRENELAQRQTVIRTGPPLAVPDTAGLLSSQERLREALKGGSPPRREEVPKPPLAVPSPSMPAAGPTAPEPPAPPVTRPAPAQKPVASPAAQPAAKPAPPPAPRPAPHAQSPAVAPPAARVPAVAVPAARPKNIPVALWAGLGVILAVLAGFGVWKFSSGGSSALGYARVTAAPWAEVTSVRTKTGKDMSLKGSTPMMLELPAGKYEIEFKSTQSVGKVDLIIKSGEISQVHYIFPEVNIHAMVDELISKY